MQVTQICLKMSKIISFQKKGIYVLSTLQFFHYVLSTARLPFMSLMISNAHAYTCAHTPTHCEFPLHNYYKHTDNITKY